LQLIVWNSSEKFKQSTKIFTKQFEQKNEPNGSNGMKSVSSCDMKQGIGGSIVESKDYQLSDKGT
jgi:hypothetical protein